MGFMTAGGRGWCRRVFKMTINTWWSGTRTSLMESSERQQKLDEIEHLFDNEEKDAHHLQKEIVYRYLMLLCPDEILAHLTKVYGVKAQTLQDIPDPDEMGQYLTTQNQREYDNASTPKAVKLFISVCHPGLGTIGEHIWHEVKDYPVLLMLLYVLYFIWAYRNYRDSPTDPQGKLADLNTKYGEFRHWSFGQDSTEQKAVADTQYVDMEIQSHLDRMVTRFVSRFRNKLEEAIAIGQQQQDVHMQDIDPESEDEARSLRLRLRL